MSEAEWLDCTESFLMLPVVGRTNDRSEAQAFACACIRQFDFLMTGTRDEMLLALAEKLAEGGPDERPVRPQWHSESWYPTWENALFHPNPKVAAEKAIEEGVRLFTGTAAGPASDAKWQEDRRYVLESQAALARDIFGNPWRSAPPVDPFLLIREVHDLATTIYENRDFGKLPALAHLLKGSGCDDTEWLGHLKGQGPHVRGCWVIDLLLGKE